MKNKLMKKIASVVALSLCICLLTGCQSADKQVSETTGDTNPEVEKETLEDFESWRGYSEDYLTELRDTYKLEELTKDCKSDYEKVETVTKWVSGLWKHDGENEPEKEEPLYILDQVVNNGQQFRCVEYGIVIEGCLQALGMDSRTIGLKMKEVETVEVGAGHVGCEVYLNDLHKWVFVDGQWGAIPMQGDTPINAYEFGKAIQSKDKELHINWVNNAYDSTDEDYYQWIQPYLYYLDTAYEGKDGKQKAIMFVPKDGKEVTVFQKKYPINMDHYTRDIKVFYKGQDEI